MLYIEKTDKSVEETVASFQEKVPDFKFGILHIHKIKDTLNSKGIDFENECQVLDVCNPNYANILLTEDMTISTIMPCKIAIYSKEGQTYIAMNSVVQLVDDINPDLVDTASEVQENLLKLINEVI